MRSVGGILKLRTVGNLAAPGLAAAKSVSSGRLPEDGCKTMRRWAKEKPLAATKMTRPRDQGYELDQAPNLDTQPSIGWGAHIGGNQPVGDLSPVGMRPSDLPKTDIRSELDEAIPRQPVQVELQSILQAHSLT